MDLNNIFDFKETIITIHNYNVAQKNFLVSLKKTLKCTDVIKKINLC